MESRDNDVTGCPVISSFTNDNRKSNPSGFNQVKPEYVVSPPMSICRSSDMSVLYAPLSWRRWNNGRIQNRLARFLLFTLHAETAADNNSNSSLSDIIDVNTDVTPLTCTVVHAMTDS